MAEERVRRRLAAILAADVVGYSRLMEQDEAGTLAGLKALRTEILDPQIRDSGGRVVKLMGDGTLAEFESAVDAVHCAVSIQKEIAARNSTQPVDRRLDLRIGVNLGDIVIEEDDIYGEGVNIAARLEALSDPGCVCISGEAYNLVRNKLDLDFIDLGKKDLKNIAAPVHAYLIRPQGGAPSPETGRSESEKSNLPAVAVLPFGNMSGDPEQEYFSDGLSEDIITALSLWRSFPVIARNSTFTYKGQQVRVQQIAEELGARYVLEGSVRKAGKRVRITTQLIDARTGHHVWASKFDRQLEDIFDVQDEITNRIAAIVVPELEHFEHRKSAVKRTEDLSAWDYYVRGMETFYDETCEGNAHSRDMFQRAVERDPNYGDAWARLGWVHARDVQIGCTPDRDESLRTGFEAARKAVALDDNSALGHISLGTVHIWANETALGLSEAQTALQLNPNFAHAAMAVGNRLDLVGETAAGIAQLEKSLQLNPRDPIRWRYMAYLARAYISLGDYETAAEWGQKSLLLRPESPDALFRQAVCLAHLDRVEEARALLDRCEGIKPGFVALREHWQPYSDQQRNDHLLAGLRRHGLIN